ncbi:hypothetical protein [Paenibacillus sp. B2(2019)]|uniref:hypothetical protein n=1 Tax=Paenibacillus sp. B2(2019) TaxID=2607754 RepID=UPI0011F1D1C3|nr:hypothetical protein [Paenibacillus sp. B2(2019)]KAA1181903.1 hypothetical protein PAENI_24455 [Paenibacillus sp. B2(2019)]
MGRIQFSGKRLVDLMFISALSVPGLLISIPLFSLFYSLNRHPIALAHQSIVVGYTNTGNYSGIFAASLLVFLPTFILYLLVSRKIVAGITIGSVKG